MLEAVTGDVLPNSRCIQEPTAVQTERFDQEQSTFNGENEKVFRAANAAVPIKTHISGALRERRLALAGRGNSVSPSVESHPHVSPPVTPPETFLPDRHKPSKIGTKGDRLLAPPKDTKKGQTTSPQQRHKTRQTQAIKKTQDATDTSHQKDTKLDRHKKNSTKTQRGDTDTKRRQTQNPNKSTNTKKRQQESRSYQDNQSRVAENPERSSAVRALPQKSHTPYTPLESRTYKNRPKKMGQTFSWRLSSLHIITTLVTPVLPRKEVEATPP